MEPREEIEPQAAHLQQQLAQLEALSRTRFAEQAPPGHTLARQREPDAVLREQAEDLSADLATLT